MLYVLYKSGIDLTEQRGQSLNEKCYVLTALSVRVNLLSRVSLGRIDLQHIANNENFFWQSQSTTKYTPIEKRDK